MSAVALEALLARLAAVRHVRFDARPGPASRTGWAGTGLGTVTTRRESGALQFIEAGQFQPAGAAPAVPFRNVYRWRLEHQQVALSHERFGVAHPVPLLALVPLDASHFVSTAPHRCAADRYRATLALEPDAVILAWSIVGPRKDEHLRYRYQP